METKGTTGEETISYWFDLPIDFAEFEEKLGVGAESGDYRIIEKVLNVDTIRTDIPTSSTVTDVIVWSIEQSGTDTFSATYEVDQQIKEGEQTSHDLFNPLFPALHLLLHESNTLSPQLFDN